MPGEKTSPANLCGYVCTKKGTKTITWSVGKNDKYPKVQKGVPIDFAKMDKEVGKSVGESQSQAT